MISVEQLQVTLSDRNYHFEQVGDFVVRFERSAHGTAFAVCYVDVGGILPSTLDDLNSYQDRVVGKRFFEGPKSLQWSTYLYFIVTRREYNSKRIRQERELIESDRKYARKFVVPEEQLDAMLTPPSFEFPSTVVDNGIVTKWVDILADANLDQAVLSDEVLPRRLQLIEANQATEAMRADLLSPASDYDKEPAIRRMEVQRYRMYSEPQGFDFGQVNLVSGRNGAGKTSLLEAIELFYCGRTNRNPNDDESYQISMRLESGDEVHAAPGRPASVFRDRNLRWYGRAETKTNLLYQSFTQFSFLNSDAAVRLADLKDPEKLTEDLSKLLVGPAASKIWREIERTRSKVEEEFKRLLELKSQFSAELTALNRQLESIPKTAVGSEVLFSQLTDLGRKIGWELTSNNTNEFRKAVGHLGTLMGQAIKCEWVGAPVSIEELHGYIGEAESAFGKAEELFAHLSTLREQASNSEEYVADLREVCELLTELKRYNDTGYSDAVAHRKSLSERHLTLQGVLFGYDEDVGLNLYDSNSSLLKHFTAATAKERASIQALLADAESRYGRFTALTEKAVGLSAQLFSIAKEILADSHAPDTCPVCHTSFPHGELLAQMRMEIDSLGEEEAAGLFDEIRKLRSALDTVRARERAGVWGLAFCEKTGVSQSLPIRQILQVIGDYREEVLAVEEALTANEQMMEGLEKQNISSNGFSELVTRLKEHGISVTTTSTEQLQTQIRDHQSAISREEARSDARSSMILEEVRAIQLTLDTDAVSQNAIGASLHLLQERISQACGLVWEIESYSDRFSFSRNTPFSAFLVDIDAAKDIANEWEQSLSAESIAAAFVKETTSKRNSLEADVARLSSRIDRLTEAIRTFDKIQHQHSLESAMEESLSRNRNAIQTIFQRIHSPSEFSEIGSNLATLVRAQDGTVASLRQVSTGQRAAYALSLFLAQNAQVRAGPKIMLIDDPIAHVDDMNSLSFLDYLRDLVVTDDRQLFFATADEKLAALFQRKFEFLGDEQFRCIHLER